MNGDDLIFVAQGGFQRLREMRRTLAATGIPAEIVQPPGQNANA
ncbi:MAG: hypothetical protein R3F34_03710 [Planctomycetota bacterium]